MGLVLWFGHANEPVPHYQNPDEEHFFRKAIIFLILEVVGFICLSLSFCAWLVGFTSLRLIKLRLLPGESPLGSTWPASCAFLGDWFEDKDSQVE